MRISTTTRICLTFLSITSITLSADKPNIILIVTDDQGYSGAGFRNPEVHAPNLDKLVDFPCKRLSEAISAILFCFLVRATLKGNYS